LEERAGKNGLRECLMHGYRPSMTSLVSQLRSVRVAGMAVFDWVATLVAAAVLAWLAGLPKRALAVPYWKRLLYVTSTLLQTGIVLHATFGVKSKLGRVMGYTV
jgi:hypothetical protein